VRFDKLEMPRLSEVVNKQLLYDKMSVKNPWEWHENAGFLEWAYLTIMQKEYIIQCIVQLDTR